MPGRVPAGPGQPTAPPSSGRRPGRPRRGWARCGPTWVRAQRRPGRRGRGRGGGRCCCWRAQQRWARCWGAGARRGGDVEDPARAQEVRVVEVLAGGLGPVLVDLPAVGPVHPCAGELLLHGPQALPRLHGDPGRGAPVGGRRRDRCGCRGRCPAGGARCGGGRRGGLRADREKQDPAGPQHVRVGERPTVVLGLAAVQRPDLRPTLPVPQVQLREAPQRVPAYDSAGGTHGRGPPGAGAMVRGLRGRQGVLRGLDDGARLHRV